MAAPLPPPPPPPPVNTTLTVGASHDYRGTSLNVNSIVFATIEPFASAIFGANQFGVGGISNTVAITGNASRNFIDVHMLSGGSFSAAGWTFSNWVPFTPLQNDQVNLYGSEYADTITGSSQADSMIGNGGSDVLYGADGNDILVGGSGLDTLYGGTGDDTYHLSSVSQNNVYRFVLDTVVENEAGGIDTVLVHRLTRVTGYTMVANVENAFINAAGAFNVFGNALGNRITGNNDFNVLEGRDGSDLLFGQGGDDVLEGGAGGDHIDGGANTDTARYSSATAGVLADLLVLSNNTGDAEGDSYVSIENLIGSAFADNLRGDHSANTVAGGLGADLLFGRGGDDILIGGGGGDRLDGSAGIDVASYADAVAGVFADLQIPANNGGDALGDSYFAIENLTGSAHSDTLRGDANANKVLGGASNDLLYGRNGNDILNGQAGFDLLSGGANADIFVFDQTLTSANVDNIRDFSVVDDTIHIDDAVFVGLLTGSLSSSAFRANTTGLAGDSTDRIIYETDRGKLYFDQDGTGGTYGSVHFATVTNFATAGALNQADFVVI